MATAKRAAAIADMASDGPALGLWLGVPDRLVIETVARAGYDFAILDGQHGALGEDTFLPAIQALDRVAAFVRVRSNDPGLVMRALDLGARGVIVPFVNTADEATQAARAARYPPEGTQSFGPVRAGYTDDGGSASPPLCFVMIETLEAMSNLTAIATTSGIDGLFVGPIDLGLSMGFDLKSALGFPPEVMAQVKGVVECCANHGLIAGSPAVGMDNARTLAGVGVQFLPLGSDIGLLLRGAAADLAQARGWSRSGALMPVFRRAFIDRSE